jgi:hypothetical protein
MKSLPPTNARWKLLFAFALLAMACEGQHGLHVRPSHGSQGRGGAGSGGAGGALGTGGVMGTGGTKGSGGFSGGGGSSLAACSPACDPDQDCESGACVLRWGGMVCQATSDCPSYATCCGGAGPACDGTRLPAGDGTNPGQYAVSTDGLTVTDKITGLVWQRDGSGSRAGCVEGLSCTWSEAQSYCAALVLGGASDWRVPARMEMLTIVDFTRSTPAIDPAIFPNTRPGFYWTSSPSGYPWALDFHDGYVAMLGVTSSYGVRCVR